MTKKENAAGQYRLADAFQPRCNIAFAFREKDKAEIERIAGDMLYQASAGYRIKRSFGKVIVVFFHDVLVRDFLEPGGTFAEQLKAVQAALERLGGEIIAAKPGDSADSPTIDCVYGEDWDGGEMTVTCQDVAPSLRVNQYAGDHLYQGYSYTGGFES